MEVQSMSPSRSSSSCTITSPELQCFRSPNINTNHSLKILKQTCIATLHTPQVSFLAVHVSYLYAACYNEIHVFDLKNHLLTDKFSCQNPSSGTVKSLAFLESKMFSAHQDCKIRVWLVTPSKKHRLLFVLPTVKDRLARCILPKNYVQIRRHKQKLWIEHADTISGLATCDRLMYSISWDKSFKIWRMSDLCCVESVKAHTDAINAIAVSCEGIVYTGSADGKIKVWKKCEKLKHMLLCTLNKHTSSVNALVLNKNGSVLFSGGSDSNIMTWEKTHDGVDYMACVGTLKGHKGAILCLVYVNDFLISGSSDTTLRIWKYSKESCGYVCVAILEGHMKPIKSIVAIESDSCGGVISIFSGSLDGEIRVWQVSHILPIEFEF